MRKLSGPSLKSRIRQEGLTIGSWLSFGFTPVCEMMAASGFDWLVVDMEHTAIDSADAMAMIQVLELAGCAPLVRVGANDPLLIKRALDAGAHGIVVPMVNSREDAERAVSSTYYPPRGRRGAGLSRAQQYGLGFAEYKAWADEETVLVVQIEHVDAVRNLRAIMAVDGVDAFIVGPYDLSGSLGRPGDWEHASVVEALDEVKTVASSRGIVGGYHVVHSNHQELEQRIAQGYRLIAYGDDMVFLAEKLRDEAAFVAELRKRR
jgi:2-dehydro-3-deoxyglucarate aldolase